MTTELIHPKARRYYALGLIGSLVGLAVNHHEAVTNGKYWVMVVFLGPFLAGLCIAGLIDPAAPLALGKDGKHFPARAKAIGFLGAVGGLAGAAFLMLLYNGRI